MKGEATWVTASLGLLLGMLASSGILFGVKPRETARLVVTATVQSGALIEVFVNNDFDRTWTTQIEAGATRRYTFDNVPEAIHALRLDVTDAAETRVTIERIDFYSGDTLHSSISGAEISRWTTNQLVPQDSSQPASYLTTGNDPFLHAGGLSLAVDAPDPTFLQTVQRYLPVLLLCAAAIHLLRGPLFHVAFLPGVVILLVTLALGRFAVPHILNLDIGTVSARDSVGNANFTGYNKVPEQWALVTTFVAAALSGLTCAIAFRSMLRRGADELALGVTHVHFRWKWVAATFILFAATNFPQLASARDALVNVQHVLSGYDWGNVFTWNFLSQYGFLPHRDYWFCYSGDWNELGSEPSSLWHVYLTQLVLVAALLVSLYEINGRRLPVTVLILLVLGYLTLSGAALGSKRYLTSVVVFLATAAVVRASPRRWLPFIVLGALYGWGFEREPLQLLYALPGIMALAIYFLRNTPGSPTRQKCARIGITLTSAAMIVACQLIVMSLHGQLSGFLSFYRHVSALGDSGAIPAAVSRWYSLDMKVENGVLLAAHLLLGFSVFYLFRPQTQFLGITLLGLALIEVMVFFKMLVRPHMGQQMFTPLVIGAGVLLSELTKCFRGSQTVAAAIIFGSILGSGLVNPNTVRAILADRRASISHLRENAAVVRELTPPIHVLDRYYAPESYRGLDADTTTLIAFLREQNLPRFGGRMYVFGDDSHLYSMLKERPCHFITLYNTADAFSQQQVVQCLQQRRPELVVWDSTFKEFDQVPNIVRVPILYDFLATHYAPERAIGRFQIMRLRRTSEPLDWNFWRRELGDTVNVGALPALSSFSDLSECETSRGSNCWDFALLGDAPNDTANKRASAEIRVGDMSFVVTFDRIPGKPLILNLSRLWFWNAGLREGLQGSVYVADSKGPVTVERRRAEPLVMY